MVNSPDELVLTNEILGQLQAGHFLSKFTPLPFTIFSIRMKHNNKKSCTNTLIVLQNVTILPVIL